MAIRDVDIDYIKSIGGVSRCFNPKTRLGTPDVGAYRPGTVTTAMPGSCVAPPITGTGGMGGRAEREALAERAAWAEGEAEWRRGAAGMAGAGGGRRRYWRW